MESNLSKVVNKLASLLLETYKSNNVSGTEVNEIVRLLNDNEILLSKTNRKLCSDKCWVNPALELKSDEHIAEQVITSYDVERDMTYIWQERMVTHPSGHFIPIHQELVGFVYGKLNGELSNINKTVASFESDYQYGYYNGEVSYE